MITLFILSVTLILYVYLGYPLIIYLLSKLAKNGQYSDGSLPTVTIIIPAYNEIDSIKANLENKVSQNYPVELLEIIVVSDESTDGTDDAVLQFAQESSVPVHLLRQEPRQGKTAGVNRAVQNAGGDILVFADANSIYANNTVSLLVDNFKNSSVGYVTGKMVYINEHGNLIGDGCSAYMKYENFLRKYETLSGSIVGVDGGVDAMRKSLYQSLNADQLPDFVQPLKVVEQGFKVAFDERAILKEVSLEDSASEFKMRVRVSLRAFWAMWDMMHLLNPVKFGFFSFKLASHKLFRYLVFIPMFTAFISNLFLVNIGMLWTVMLLLQIGFYVFAYISTRMESKNLFSKLASYFCILNLASFVAFLSFVRGRKIVTWTPRVG